VESQLQNFRDALESKIDELRKSQEELEASRNKYAFLYDFAPVGYFSLDREGLIKTVNMTGVAMVGAEADALIARHFEDLVASEDRLLFSKFIDKVFASGVKETCRLKLSVGDQRELPVRIEAMATEAADECLTVLIDITERNQAEQALAESQYNLAKAQSMTHVGSWSFDPRTAAVKASDELLNIMCLSRKEATQEAFANVVHPEDYAAVMEHLRLGVEFGKGYEIEHRLLLGDGTTRWVYTIVEPSIDSAGKVVKLYGTTQDITERKRAEVELNNKTNELQAIFDSIGDGIVVYDHGGRVQHHNRIAPRLFPQAIHIGARCRTIFHPDLPTTPNECPVEQAIHGERVDTSLVCMRDGDKMLYLDVTATPIKDEAGEKSRALVFFRDISKKRLQEMHLIQAEKMSSLGVLATGVAHEINNPIASVAGYAEAMLRRLRDDPVLNRHAELEDFPQYLGVIVREAYRCKAITDQLLVFGRKSDGVAVDVDLNGLLQEITELLRHHPSYRQVNMVTSFFSGLPHILADPSGLRQVFMNLLINAYQAIEESGQVELSTGCHNGTQVFVRIRDNGPGIGPDAIDKIWDPFYTTKEVGQGVGLGLALTYDIVKRHGGTIEVASRPGEGAEFTVLLPLRPE
jgi:PAS domain S-box-containing protein